MILNEDIKFINLLTDFVEGIIDFHKFEEKFMLDIFFNQKLNNDDVLSEIISDLMCCFDACNINSDIEFDSDWDITLYECTSICTDFLNKLNKVSFKITLLN